MLSHMCHRLVKRVPLAFALLVPLVRPAVNEPRLQLFQAIFDFFGDNASESVDRQEPLWHRQANLGDAQKVCAIGTVQ